MNIKQAVEDQDNVVDGTVFVTDRRTTGAFVTVAGKNDSPIIVAFDNDDLATLAKLSDPTQLTWFAEPQSHDTVRGELHVGAGVTQTGRDVIGLLADGAVVLLSEEQARELAETLRTALEPW